MRKLKTKYKFWSTALIIIVLSIVIYKVFIEPDQFKLNRRKYPIIGIDISKNNGKIKWEVLSNQISFVYMKVTEGKT